MQNQDERPNRYTDPDNPYSGSGNRYQNRYSRTEYHKGDGVFQFPWWAILLTFISSLWPIGIAMIVMNAMIKNGKLGGFERKMYYKTTNFTKTETRTVYDAESRPVQEGTSATVPPSRYANGGNGGKPTAQTAPKKKSNLALGLTIAGGFLLAAAVIALPDATFWLFDALAEGDYYWRWLFQDITPVLIMAAGGAGCLIGAHKIRTSHRLRKKLAAIVGDAHYMYIEDIASALPCSYEKCCKHLENCIDSGLFGPDAYLDMHRRCLVVSGKPPKEEAAPAAAAKPAPEKPKETPAQTEDQYQKILNELRRLNDAIPGEEMSDKISRLEAVSAKIFAQAKTDPDKLPKMRKFMDYYLPTSLKLLEAYAELDAQGVEGENISESKRRIEQTMDTLVHAFETQLDQLFQADAMDISADIDVMQNMLRADGLADDTPFKM